MKVFHYIILTVFCLTVQLVSGQDRLPAQATPHRSARSIATDTSSFVKLDTTMSQIMANADSASIVKMQKSVVKHKRDWTKWTPNPRKALWLALLVPGAGQIYNRKFWKLPIVYGGILGCAYAMRWNNQMYNDYSQAYNDLIDNDPNTQSYTQFLHLGNTITSANAERYKSIFKSRKDTYRRWRDLSLFVMLGVYALSVIDAYVDASLSKFDISDDISLRVEPAVINASMRGVSNASTPSDALINNNAIGVHGSLTF